MTSSARDLSTSGTSISNTSERANGLLSRTIVVNKGRKVMNTINIHKGKRKSSNNLFKTLANKRFTEKARHPYEQKSRNTTSLKPETSGFRENSMLFKNGAFKNRKVNDEATN